MVLLLMTTAAAVVGAGGWVARALVHAGHLPGDVTAGQAFYVATDFLSQPGMFGLILAALTAALMSTVDTLITAVAAVLVNDVYRPYIRPRATDGELLRVARVSSVTVTALGVGLVPLFMMFDSIYEAHGAFTAAATPPLVVTLLLSVFWRRFTRTAALATLAGGMVAIVVSLFVPEVIRPFAHGVPMGEAGDGFLSGMTQYKFMRALYGLTVCGVIGVVVTLLTRPETEARQRGLVWGTVADALRGFKGSPGTEGRVRSALAVPVPSGRADATSEGGWPLVRISRSLATSLDAGAGDLLHISDRRRWLGGLRSSHGVVEEIVDGDAPRVELGPRVFAEVAGRGRERHPVRVERLY
jgi:hypothetical protein